MQAIVSSSSPSSSCNDDEDKRISTQNDNSSDGKHLPMPLDPDWYSNWVMTYYEAHKDELQQLLDAQEEDEDPVRWDRY